MIIPNTIKLAGRTIKIKFKPELKDWGRADIEKQEILLVDMKNESTNVHFLHELVHWLLYVAGEDDLTDNEKLVSQLSELLYQVLPQIEGEKKWEYM